MALKKLPKNKAEVKFINPETMEVECTYSECFQKFVESDKYLIKTPGWNNYKPIKHKSYFHKCTECGRSYANPDDKKKSISSYESSIVTRPFELTNEDMKVILKQLKKIYESTIDTDKKKLISKVLNSYTGKLQNGYNA